MIADPSCVVMTAQLARWADEHPERLAWIIECLGRHNARDWGDLDQMDAALNDNSVVRRAGRVLSRYVVPTALLDGAGWLAVADELADPLAVGDAGEWQIARDVLARAAGNPHGFMWRASSSPGAPSITAAGRGRSGRRQRPRRHDQRSARRPVSPELAALDRMTDAELYAERAARRRAKETG